MDTPYNKLVEYLQKPLSFFGAKTRTDVEAKIFQNISRPIGTDPKAVASVFGTPDEFMASYENFEKLYKYFLTEEIQSGMISADQRRLLQSAANAPKIDMSLIRNVKNKRELQAAFGQAFNMQGIVENFGAPGFPIQSGNLFSMASKYLVDQYRTRRSSSISIIKFNYGKY